MKAFKQLTIVVALAMAFALGGYGISLAYLTALSAASFTSGTFSGTVTSGANGGTGGALVLNGATAGTLTIQPAASTTPSYTLTYPAAAPSQGALDTYSNSTGTKSSVADVATGSVLTSGGVNTVPAYSTVPAAALSAQSSVANFYRSYHAGSSNAVVSNSAANFIPFDGVAAAQATNEGDVSTIAANVATVKNLKCVLTTAAGVVTVAGGTSYVIALDQNLVAGALTCTIATAASACADTSHIVTLAIGDQLDYLVTPSGTPTALVVKCAAEVDI